MIIWALETHSGWLQDELVIRCKKEVHSISEIVGTWASLMNVNFRFEHILFWLVEIDKYSYRMA